MGHLVRVCRVKMGNSGLQVGFLPCRVRRWQASSYLCTRKPRQEDIACNSLPMHPENADKETQHANSLFLSKLTPRN